MFRLIFLVGLIVLQIVAAQWNIPKSISICSRNQRKFTNCVKESIHSLRSNLIVGQLDDVQIDQFDPVALDDIYVDRGADFRFKIFNVFVRNAKTFKIEKFKFDLKKYTIDILMTLDTLDFRGNYDMDMKLSLLRFAGQGKLNASLVAGKGRVKMLGSTYLKDGQEYFKINNCGVKLKFERVPIYLDNLFPGNKDLSATGNQILNDNIDLFLEDIIPSVERSLANKFKNTANIIFALAPFNQIVPE